MSLDKRPVRFHKLLSGPKRKDGKGENNDVDGMDDGHAQESKDETRAQECNKAVMSEDTAADFEPQNNSGKI